VLKIWENYITELHDRPNRPVTLDVEPEEEVDADEKGPYILQSKVEKAIKEMRKTMTNWYQQWYPTIHLPGYQNAPVLQMA